MADSDSHERTPLAAIVGLSESLLQRDDLDADLLTQLRAIRALAQDALEASDATSRADESSRP
jgi:signal transduction histidine kinase